LKVTIRSQNAIDKKSTYVHFYERAVNDRTLIALEGSMRKLDVAVFAAVGALALSAGLFAGTALAADVRVKLAAPVAAPVKVIVDGRLWSCAADVCVGSGQGKSQPLKRECARVAKAIGPVVEFSRASAALDAKGVAACNGTSASQAGSLAGL